MYDSTMNPISKHSGFVTNPKTFDPAQPYTVAQNSFLIKRFFSQILRIQQILSIVHFFQYTPAIFSPQVLFVIVGSELTSTTGTIKRT
jgi:hypothetical protein